MRGDATAADTAASMSSTSGAARVGKRSIVGTRVAVPVTAAGETLYVPAVVHSTRVLGLETSYCVFFTTAAHDSHDSLRALLPSRREYRAEQIIGPGFQSVSAVRRFATGQRVFLTHKGREVTGSVLRHDPMDGGLLLVQLLPQPPAPDSLLEPPPASSAAPALLLTRRIDDVRLLESRKSQRLTSDVTGNGHTVAQHVEWAAAAATGQPDDGSSPVAVRNGAHLQQQRRHQHREAEPVQTAATGAVVASGTGAGIMSGAGAHRETSPLLLQ